MRSKLLIFILALLPSICFAADQSNNENGYQAILDLDEVQLKEQSIQKGEEFIESVQEGEDRQLDYNFVSLRNEFHETIKVIFENSDGESYKELYLNAYEDLPRLALPKGIEFKIHVINVFGQKLGTLRGSILGLKKIKISPFLLVKEYSFKQPKIRVIEQQKAELIFKQEPNSPEKEEIQDLQEQSIEVEVKNRPIKVANISSKKVHVDIVESDGRPIGAGWTIPNESYEAQILKYKTRPVEISPDAMLILEVDDAELKRERAGDLALDPDGNFIWFVNDPL